MLSLVLGMAALVSLATFVAFGIDKRRARSGRRRLRERTLLTMAWATGFAGGWLAMVTFRHKTRSPAFQLKMGLVTIGNLLWALLWLALRAG